MESAIFNRGYAILKKVFSKIFITVIFSSILLTIILYCQTLKLNGDALSGYHDEGAYYILTYDKEYKEVSRVTWYFNSALLITTVLRVSVLRAPAPLREEICLPNVRVG